MDPADGVVLFSHLEAIGRRDPALAARLMGPAKSDHLQAEAGLRCATIHGVRIALDSDPAVRARLVQDARAARSDVLLLGGGCPRLVQELLGALPEGRRLLVWDADLAILQDLLQALPASLSRALATGQLSVALGVDLVALRAERDRWHLLLADDLEARCGTELRFFRRDPASRRAFVVTGGLYVRSMERALERAGFEVLPLRADALGVAEHAHAVRVFAPEAIFAINLLNGMAEFSAQLNLPLVVWEIDPCLSPPRAPDASADHVRLFSYRRASVRAWRAAGYAHATYLPLAADIELRAPLELSPADRAHYARPLSYVGSSLALQAASFRARILAAWQRHAGTLSHGEAELELQALLARQESAGARCIVREELLRRAPGFLHAAERSGLDFDPVVMIGELGAGARRQRIVGALGASGIEVWGDAGWRVVQGTGATWRGPAGHERELTKIYVGSDINLDIGRSFQSDIVTMRVFDILATGGFLLAERSRDLSDHFAIDREIIAWSDEAELQELVRHYRERPAERRTIAERGRQAVLDRHRFDQRVAHMLATLEPQSHHAAPLHRSLNHQAV